jgi:hypothetical protein
MESARGPYGLPVERDAYFTPTKFSDLGASGEFLRGARRKTAGDYAPGASDYDPWTTYRVYRNDPIWGDTAFGEYETLEEAELVLAMKRRESPYLDWKMRSSLRRKTAGDYAPGASDEFAGSGGPYSTGEYPDDDPSLPDGYDRNVSTSEPTMPQQMTLEGPQDATGVGDGSDDPSRIWAEAMTRGERAYRKAKVAKYAVENGGDNWTNFGSGFELAGSAWVTLHGDNAFVRWAKANRLVRQTAGGYRFEVPGRAHDRAAAYAREVVAVLSAAGVPASHGSEVED